MADYDKLPTITLSLSDQFIERINKMEEAIKNIAKTQEVSTMTKDLWGLWERWVEHNLLMQKAVYANLPGGPGPDTPEKPSTYHDLEIKWPELNDENLERAIKHIKSQAEMMGIKVNISRSRTHTSRNMFSDEEIKDARNMIVAIADGEAGDMETLEACKYILGCNPWDPMGCE